MEKKTTRRTIGAENYTYSKKEVDGTKKFLRDFDSHYEMSVFESYKHNFSRKNDLLKNDTFLSFFNHHARFQNKTQEEILSFIKEHSQELRDMFIVEANIDDSESVYPYETYYELDENFNLIRKVKFYNSPEQLVISATFLFADLVRVLWKKYNNESIDFKILKQGFKCESFEVDGTQVKEPIDGSFLKEWICWNNDNRQ